LQILEGAFVMQTVSYRFRHVINHSRAQYCEYEITGAFMLLPADCSYYTKKQVLKQRMTYLP